jgi:hypothetical protein
MKKWAARNVATQITIFEFVLEDPSYIRVDLQEAIGRNHTYAARAGYSIEEGGR